MSSSPDPTTSEPETKMVKAKKKMTMRAVSHDNMYNVYYMIAHEHPKLIDLITKSTMATVDLPMPTEEMLIKLRSRNWTSDVEVWNEDTVTAGLILKSSGFTPAIRNNMNAEKETGGFVEGSVAQEECICARSTLPISLFNLGNFDKNRSWSYPIPPLGVITTSNQVIFRDEDYNMLPLDKWETLDILSAAACDLRDQIGEYSEYFEDAMSMYKERVRLWKKKNKKGKKNKNNKSIPAVVVRSRFNVSAKSQSDEQDPSNNSSNDNNDDDSESDSDIPTPSEEPIRPVPMPYAKLVDLLFNEDVIEDTRKRCRNVFLAAYYNGNDSIVEGAPGCGVFANPPHKVAQIMKEEIQKEPFCFMFRKVVFSITNGKGRPCENYDVFKSILCPTTDTDTDSSKNQSVLPVTPNTNSPKREPQEDTLIHEESPSKKSKA